MRFGVEQVQHHYGERIALKGISFEAEKGEILGVLGPNGAGKSTLLRILSGIMPPTRGAFTLDGRPCTPTSLEFKKKVGYLPETPPLYPEMSVEAYLRFCADLRGVSTSKRSVETALTQCHLHAVKKRLIGELSTGFQQRVGIAQAILHNPPILILDEPTTGLDPAQIIKIRQLLRELSHDKIILFSTHILTEVTALCERVLILNQGEIRFDGAVGQFNAPHSTQWEYRFLGSPPPEMLAQWSKEFEGESLSADRIRFHRIPDDATAAQLLAQMESSNAQPVEAHRHTPSLEQLFIELTCRASEEEIA